MKSFITITAMFAATTSASPLANMASSKEFCVKDLQISSLAHGAQSRWGLNVTVSPDVPPFPCSTVIPIGPTVPSLEYTGCSDPLVSFGYTIMPTGSWLNVTWEFAPGQNLTGKHWITKQEMPYLTYGDGPNGYYQEYDGPSSFIVTPLEQSGPGNSRM